MARNLQREATVVMGDELTNKVIGEFKDFSYRALHVWSMRKTDVATTCFADDFSLHLIDNGLTLRGLQAFINFCHMAHNVLTEFHVVVEDIICEGTLQEGKSVVRFVTTGLWTKNIGNTPPTNERITIPGIAIFTVKNGKIDHSINISGSHTLNVWNAAWATYFAAQQ